MGKLSLVGAGPGDMGLLTQKAIERVREADVIVYDHLIPASLLNEAKLEAKLIYAGKRAGNHHLRQEEINALLVKLTEEYASVVRLKGGDPYVFGRGGEEVQAMEEAGLAYEVVSGISSPIAALAYAGIPITHRDYASSFHVVTGHAREDKTVDYRKFALSGGTLVFMMSLGNIAKIIGDLREGGLSGESAVSIISCGSMDTQSRYDFTLDSLAALLKRDKERIYGIPMPALLVVGEVAKLHFSWFLKDKCQKPLFQKKILITGTRQMCRKLVPEIEKAGGSPICLSLIETRLRDEGCFAGYIENLRAYSHIIFTSSNGVDAFFGYLRQADIDQRNLSHIRFAVIGTGTAESLKKHGYRADFVPGVFTGKALAKDLLPHLHAQDKLILFRAREAGQEIIDTLEEHHIAYDDVGLYETWIDERRKEELNRLLEETDYVTVASGSAAKALVRLLEDKKKMGDKLISIGPVSTGICQSYGLKVRKTAKTFDAKGLVEAICAAELERLTI